MPLRLAPLTMPFVKTVWGCDERYCQAAFSSNKTFEREVMIRRFVYIFDSRLEGRVTKMVGLGVLILQGCYFDV